MVGLAGVFFIGVFAFVLLWFEGVLITKKSVLICGFLLILAFGTRAYFLDFETTDYQWFLTKWVSYFAKNGFKGLASSVGNYNVPYLYILLGISRIPASDLHLIKLVSIFFDVILAWGAMRICYLFTNNLYRVLSSFFVVLFLPTVFINGAIWGQCDSIYTSFAVWSIYFALSDKPCLSMVFIALSFSFKLQAIFIFPVYLIFIYTGKIKWWQLLLFPVTYIITCIPSLIAGRPAWELISLYFNQMGSIGSGLNYNSPSVFAMIRGAVDIQKYSLIGIVSAFIYIIIIYIVTFMNRSKLTNSHLLIATVLMAIGVPLLLPHMHDRYFFMGDIFTTILAFTIPVTLLSPVLVSFASLLGYYAYFKAKYLIPMRYGTYALFVAIAMIVVLPLFNINDYYLKTKHRKKRK